MLRSKLLVPFVIIVLVYSAKEITGKFEFTNVKCLSLDKKFSEFEYCYLKSVNRTYKYLSIKSILHQTAHKVRFNLALFKRVNGYRPFMYNVSVDVCRFQRNKNSNQIMKYFYETAEQYSNFNHPCPYNDYIIIEKLPIDFVNNRTSIVLPFPEGEYMLETNWIAYDINRAVIKIYGRIF